MHNAEIKTYLKLCKENFL